MMISTRGRYALRVMVDLAELVRKITPDVPITICQHEPFSGAHVGPGMLGIFFRGVER